MKCCYLREGDRVVETDWTTGRGCEVMGNSYGMLDMTVHGREEAWEDSPEGWPQPFDTNLPGDAFRLDERPIAQWSRIAAGRSDDLGTSGTADTRTRCHCGELLSASGDRRAPSIREGTRVDGDENCVTVAADAVHPG